MTARKMKASGIEWIGEIPEEWKVGKVCRFYDIQLGKMLQPEMESNDDTYEYYLCAANVGKNELKLDSIKQMWMSPEEKESLLVRKGDMLVVEGGDIASCDIVSHEIGNVYFQNSLHRVRATANDDIRILKYLLWVAKSEGHIDLICNKATIAHFSKDKFSSLQISLPPLPEQRRIADFLDRKCAEIDRVVAETEKTIEEYKVLRQSIITEAVTKGVRGKRPMKDSGIEWIGEIPEEWEVALLKYSISWKSEKGAPDAQVLSLYRDYGVIPKDSRDDNHNVTSLDTSGYKVVDVGDFVINKMKAWQGSMAISKYRGIVSPAYHVCVINNSNINKQYFHHLLRNQLYLPEYLRLSSGMRIGQWDLGFDDFKNLPFILPNEEEQQEIVEYIDRKCAEIDRLVAAKQDLLAELATYKKSVIYEFVTGKKEVPECL